MGKRLPDGTTPVMVNIPPDLARKIDSWRRRRFPIPNLSAAIRELLSQALTQKEKQ
jgi:hypothetical protein